MDNRAFLKMAAEAAFTNPFSEGREGLDFRIAGVGPEAGRAAAVDMVIARISAHVKRLDASGKADVRVYSGSERELMRAVFLFDVFHRFMGEFDGFIVRQAGSGDEPCPVPFASSALSMLHRRGFTQTEAVRYFAIIYQLRRAFYFISKGLVGRSHSMRALRMHLWDSVFTHDINRYESCLWDRMEDFSTLLLGETGTGKGAAAAAVGRSGFIPFDGKKGCFAESFMRNFIPINLSQFPESLIESELFGHKKGAFTGAIENHDGAFSRCAPHGSIFLDEVGDVSVPVQVKLLQVLQERTFSPVGSHDNLRFHGRVIAATNRPVDELRREGRFRDDFYYRISSDIITVPPLRQRITEDAGELELLVSHLLGRMLGGVSGGVPGMVLDVLAAGLPDGYRWPGNVRELEQAVRRVLVNRRYDGDTAPPSGDPFARLCAGVQSGSIDAERLVGEYCRLLYARFGTYEETARRTGLDRRTVKRYIEIVK